MNVFNRLLIIVLSLCLAVVALAIFLVTVGATTPAQLAPTTWLANRLEPFANLSGSSWNWAVIVSLLLVILGVLLFAIELPKPNPRTPFVLKDDGLGRVTLARDGLRRLINRAAGEVPGVMEVRSRVEEHKKGFDIRCRVSVEPSSDVSQLTAAVQEHVQDAVQRFLGRPVATVQVNAQLEPLNPAGGRVR